MGCLLRVLILLMPFLWSRRQRRWAQQPGEREKRRRDRDEDGA